jgi:hypothetical protein
MSTRHPHHGTGANVTETRIDGWTFRRASAAYVDVCPPGASGTAVDCVNVYDYQAGEPTIGYSREELRTVATEWLREHDHRERREYAAMAGIHL